MGYKEASCVDTAYVSVEGCWDPDRFVLIPHPSIHSLINKGLWKANLCASIFRNLMMGT